MEIFEKSGFGKKWKQFEVSGLAKKWKYFEKFRGW
jgi:hypothetical protein